MASRAYIRWMILCIDSPAALHDDSHYCRTSAALPNMVRSHGSVGDHVLQRQIELVDKLTHRAYVATDIPDDCAGGELAGS